MSDGQYFPIPLATLTSDRPLRFDIYLPVGPRFVNYSRRGQPVDEDRLQRLHQKNIDTVYIHILDRLAYETWLAEDADRAFRGGDSLKERVNVIVAYGQSVSARFMDNLKDEDVYRQLRSSCERLVSFLGSEPFAVGQILAAPTAATTSVLRHSVNVATLAIAMVQKKKLPNGTPTHLLALGCLLHDVDHYLSGRDLTRRPEAMPTAERRGYEDHPLNGAKIFGDLPFVDQLVMNVVAQHEEMMDGSGYPRKLKEDRMDPLVLVAGAANAYDRLVSFERKPPRDALKHLLIDKMGQYPLEDLKILQDVLKVAEVV
jgi:HD-GYP domain-containing protein (c-di-GMP phosphodiesterase class II)